MKFIISILIAIFIFNLNAQIPIDLVSDCVTAPPDSNMTKTQTCSIGSPFNISNYEWFDIDNSTPIKTIQLNFIFLQRNNGSVGFDKDNLEHQILFDEIAQQLNNRYSSLVNYSSFCYTGGLECFDDTDFFGRY